MTLVGLSDLMMTCLLCMLCALQIQLTLTQKKLELERERYEVLYYYTKTGHITNESRYQKAGECIQEKMSHEQLCFSNGRIFTA